MDTISLTFFICAIQICKRYIWLLGDYPLFGYVENSVVFISFSSEFSTEMEILILTILLERSFSDLSEKAEFKFKKKFCPKKPICRWKMKNAGVFF